MRMYRVHGKIVNKDVALRVAADTYLAGFNTDYLQDFIFEADGEDVHPYPLRYWR
jgi:hypothetical protein